MNDRDVQGKFAEGNLRGKAARLYVAVGTVVVRTDRPTRRFAGKRQRSGRPIRGPKRKWIKITDSGPYHRRWIPLARWLWRKWHGPIPRGYVIVHADGDTMNDTPENLVCLSRGEAMRRRRQAWQYEQIMQANAKAARLQKSEKRRRMAKLLSLYVFCGGCGWQSEPDQRVKQCPHCGRYAMEQRRLPRERSEDE